MTQEQLNKLTTSRLSRDPKTGKITYSEVGATKRCGCTYIAHNDRITEECIGKTFEIFKPCPECDAKGYIKKEKKAFGKMQMCKVKCEHCNGDGRIWFEKPIITGVCPKCNGKLYETKVSVYDSAIEADLAILYEIIDFEGTYEGKQTFNESYLGIGLCGGITDYGRYLKLNPEEFKQEVWKQFVQSHGRQYLTWMKMTTKNGRREYDPELFCDKIIIKKSSNGWTLYPVWDNQVSSEATSANQLWNDYVDC